MKPGRREAPPVRPLHACMTTSLRSPGARSNAPRPLGTMVTGSAQTDRCPGNPTACTRRPCPCDRPRSRHALLMNAGRSSDSQAQPAACLLASRTVSPFRSQWPDNSRPLIPVWEIRLDTAAGPSRNRTGVPCLPVVHSCKRPATRFVAGVYRWCHPCQAVTIGTA